MRYQRKFKRLLNSMSINESYILIMHINLDTFINIYKFTDLLIKNLIRINSILVVDLIHLETMDMYRIFPIQLINYSSP